MRNARTQQRTTAGGARRTATSRRQPATGHARPGARTTSRLARTLVEHDEIRRWAEQRGGQPAAVKGTGRGKDIGMIRIDFPGYSGEGKLVPIDWDEWFDKFEQSNLALVVQDKTAGGEISHFNKLIAREGGPRRAGSRTRTGARAGTTPRARAGSKARARPEAGSRSKAGSRSEAGSRSAAASRPKTASRSKAASRPKAGARSRSSSSRAGSRARSRAGAQSPSR